ncbi:MAG TPA: hypothetical protein VKT30_09560 [Caulobacteraceae bacterium]|nr:hypothetical protein [Caulobacteraceae bacterium]
MTRTISADDLDFSERASSLVYSDTLRFILPVPKLSGGGEPLVPPPGEKAADSFVDHRGRPIQGRGVVFYNPDDECWQAAPGDGSAVIILSPVDEAKGELLAAKALGLNPDPERLTLDEIKAVVAYGGELGIGAAYDSTRAFVAEKMTPFDENAPPGFGLHWRKAHDQCRAIFVPGAGRFRGPAATPQTFKDGCVIIKQGESVRLAQTRSFEATYRFPDGRLAKASELKVQDPKG